MIQTILKQFFILEMQLSANLFLAKNAGYRGAAPVRGVLGEATRIKKKF